MNRSWKNTSSSSSGGFIYFNREFFNKNQSNPNSHNVEIKHSHNSIDSQDFLAFNNFPIQNSSSSTQHGFSPSNFSSPKYNPHHSRSPYQYNKSPRGRARGLYGNHSANSSRSFGHNQNKSWQKNGRHSGYGDSSSSQNGSTSIFYDHTCLENPWSELEKQLAEKTLEENEERERTKQNTEASEASESDSSEEGDSSEENEQSCS